MVLDCHADRAVQLVRDGGDRPDRAAHRHLGHRHRVFGLGAVESVVGSGCDRQSCCGACTLDLTGHRGQRVLHRLERAQRLAELLPLAGVRDGEFGGRVQHADDLHAARPGAATDELVADGQVYRGEAIGGQVEGERSAGFTGQIVRVGHVDVVGNRDVKRVGGARGEHNGG